MERIVQAGQEGQVRGLGIRVLTASFEFGSNAIAGTAKGSI